MAENLSSTKIAAMSLAQAVVFQYYATFEKDPDPDDQNVNRSGRTPRIGNSGRNGESGRTAFITFKIGIPKSFNIEIGWSQYNDRKVIKTKRFVFVLNLLERNLGKVQDIH